MSCSVSELSCVSVKNFTLPAVVIDVIHHNNCCAYNHRARAGPWEYFDEYYNQTMLDRYKNFTLFLEIGHNVTLPEKCMNLTCRQVWLINQKESTDVHKRKYFYQVTFTSVYCTKCFISSYNVTIILVLLIRQ